MKKIVLYIAAFIVLNLDANMVQACTNLMVTGGASADGSTMITYAADSHRRYGYLFHYPAMVYPEGAMVDLYHYEHGAYLGQIPQVRQTYGVIGMSNEYGVSIGETTFGGLKELQKQEGGLLDYGSLMKLALQRAKTAREAIKVIDELVQKYGYMTSGESFSISDPNEVWIMELIGKGNHEKGAVWVARRVPEGYVCGHANQARITTFPFQKKNKWDNPKQNCFHSPDVISFARKIEAYSGSDEDFSFSDVYAPLDFGGVRFCDARVWTFFRRVSKAVRDNEAYTEYAMGTILYDETFPDGRANPNKFPTNRLPLWVKPDEKVSLADVKEAMRDYFQDTPMDMTQDPGAGPFELPYRWRPLTYKVDGQAYCNERAIATQQTGYSFVTQSRPDMPRQMGTIFWFGVDDTRGTVYTPMYCGITDIPVSFKKSTGSFIEWSDKSAFWVFNLVNNWSYTRYNLIHPEVRAYQQAYEERFRQETAELEKELMPVFELNPQVGIQKLTEYSVQAGDELTAQWHVFFHYLFMKYVDGNMKKTKDMQILDNGNGQGIPFDPEFPGYGEEWYKKLVKETGDKFKMKASPKH